MVNLSFWLLVTIVVRQLPASIASGDSQRPIGKYWCLSLFFPSFKLSKDILLIKLNSYGKEIWRKAFEGEGNAEALDIVKVENNNYAFIGNTTSDSNSNSTQKLWLVNIDEFGNINWQKTDRAESNSSGTGVLYTGNGEYVISGYNFKDFNLHTNAWIKKLGPYPSYK